MTATPLLGCEPGEAGAQVSAPVPRVIDGETPRDVSLLLWWRPVGSNTHAESWVIGQLSSSEPGKWWGGGRYQDIWHVTHWLPLPAKVVRP